MHRIGLARMCRPRTGQRPLYGLPAGQVPDVGAAPIEPNDLEFRSVRTYLARMPNHAFSFYLPTRATTVPATPDWLHEVKYDGYRLRLERDGDRARR